MTAARRAAALGVALALHLLPLVLGRWPQPRLRLVVGERLPLRVALVTRSVTRPGVDRLTPDPDLPPREITIRQRRTLHLPPGTARRPATRPRYRPAPSPPPLPDRSGPWLDPPRPAARPLPPPAGPPSPAPIVAALARSQTGDPRPVMAGRVTWRVVFLPPGESATAALARHGAPLVLVSADDQLPEDTGRDPAPGDGLAGADLGLTPPDFTTAPPGEAAAVTGPPTAHGTPEPAVTWQPWDPTAALPATGPARSWWALWGMVAPRRGMEGGRLVALWLPSSLRAGWEATAPGALAVWDALTAAPGLAGLAAP